MKNFYKIVPVIVIITLSILSIGFKQGENQHISILPKLQKRDIYDMNLSDMIEIRRGNLQVEEIRLFTKMESDNLNHSGLLTKSTSLKINNEVKSKLLRNGDINIDLVIPDPNGRNMKLKLTKVEVTSSDFIISTVGVSGKSKFNYQNTGLHYRGIIDGETNSIASLSIFDEFVMGLFSGKTGNYVLGSVMKDGKYTDDYIFYNDSDLKVLNKFKCGIGEDNGENFNVYSVTEFQKSHGQNGELDEGRAPVQVYFVCDYDMYQKAGNNVQAVGSFVTGLFNSVATIYQKEYLKVQISEIQVYTSPDPYRFTNNSVDILFEFGRNTRDNFNGDLAHLLSTRTINAGGIAWINVLCANYSGNSQEPYGRFAYSNIETSYNNFPTYSWTVGVIAHEMGHNFGSQHTHACAWPVGGYIGAIDSCYTAEGNCFPGQFRSIGTIMSYCHLWAPTGDTSQGGGINFARGFGVLPGDTIRLRYNQAACFGPTVNVSELPVTFNLLPNYPNPFNPITNLKFAVPENANVTIAIFDIRGREVARLMSNKYFNQGIYTFQFDASLYQLSSGVYFYKMYAVNPVNNTGVYSNVRKMILMK
ncbi:MAG: M12 family metallo-peptidase [Ignavibacteriaceae bacterium]|jgi:Reprolysin family propeptide./Reprolysin (M12B) family zinc metalloprotease.|nr:MAG: T9SS C-terminal target domain-containing protein [Chlorobiota bacterium]KXK02270.1 MAG: peptidase S8/S53 subtilisin kexin sedolisin [Chlorobi bacterium OLB4]MBV6399697.1 hypothetical protein [Ignavibacteria bacterium]MCC6885620.1 zinc-dependent metalloprotease [Ignavibacteriales bacterium]MCE7954000.1 T9SS C-terminal target domain-containing protein [Chlorobi bacterium CHB7]MDL1887899.1 T9SS type A sorting domain-containing protein [Ignavibacteria bacterium CHB1]MEB2330564.1 M12 famil